MNFQMFKLDLEKAEEPEIKLLTSTGSQKKQENSRKISTSALLIMPKPLTVWITTVENSSKDGNTTAFHLPPQKSIRRSRSQQLEPEREQWTSSKLGKEYVKAVYCIYLTFMQSISGEMRAG